jgi:hypothetical protein
MSGFLIAWLVGLSLSITHEIYSYKVDAPATASPLPIKPGRILIASGIYVGLAILAEAESFRSTATLMAWGYNIAIALRWAQEYSANQAQIKKYPGTLGAASGTAFWNPPVATDNTLFPTGAGKVPTTPTTLNTSQPGSPSGGPLAT